MTNGCSGFLLHQDGGGGCGEGAGCMATGGPGFRRVLLWLPIRIKIKEI